jgi:hypothetical protein
VTSDGEGDAARARPRGVRLDGEPVVLVDLQSTSSGRGCLGVGRRTAYSSIRSLRKYNDARANGAILLFRLSALLAKEGLS